MFLGQSPIPGAGKMPGKKQCESLIFSFGKRNKKSTMYSSIMYLTIHRGIARIVRISQGQVPLTKHNGIIVKCLAHLVQHQL